MSSRPPPAPCAKCGLIRNLKRYQRADVIEAICHFCANLPNEPFAALVPPTHRAPRPDDQAISHAWAALMQDIQRQREHGHDTSEQVLAILKTTPEEYRAQSELRLARLEQAAEWMHDQAFISPARRKPRTRRKPPLLTPEENAAITDATRALGQS